MAFFLDFYLTHSISLRVIEKFLCIDSWNIFPSTSGNIYVVTFIFMIIIILSLFFFWMCMCFLNPTLFFNKTTVHFSLTFYFNISYKNAFIYTALSINVNLAYTVDICVIYKLINIQEFSCRMKLNAFFFRLHYIIYSNRFCTSTRLHIS